MGTSLCIQTAHCVIQVLLQSSGEMVWHPNVAMRSTVLINLSRSGTKWEGYSWLVDLDTPDEVSRGQIGLI